MNPETGYVPETKNKNVIVVVTEIALGEGGKGADVEWFNRELEAHTDIRSGGCQAGHHLVFADNTDFSFSHFSCGTFEGAKTHLKHMVISPLHLLNEAMELEDRGIKDAFKLITIDEDCLTITPFHGSISKIREIARGDNKKGTIGMGVGEAIEDSRDNPELTIRANDLLSDRATLYQRVEAIRQDKLKQAQDIIATAAALKDLESIQEELHILEDQDYSQVITQAFLYLANLVKVVGEDYIDEILGEKGAIVCEPSHGALHHPRQGFVPHITHIDPTSQDVLKTLNEHNTDKKIIRIGVSRCYITRHGAGPLPSFNREMTDQIRETHNEEGSWWLGEFRNGNYDFIAARYALRISGGKETFDGLMISHLDILAKFDEWPVVEAYTYEGEPAEDLDQFFDISDGKITGIKFQEDDGTNAHLERQKRLTHLITHCKPVLTTLKAHDGKSLEDVFLDYVEEKLGIPVIAVAHGPKAEDREKRQAWNKVFGMQ